MPDFSEMFDAVKMLAAAFGLMTAVAGWFGYDGYQANEEVKATRDQMVTVVNHYHQSCK